MTVTNGNNIQLMGMSEENMNVMHVHGVACLHTHVCVQTHSHTCVGFPAMVDSLQAGVNFTKECLAAPTFRALL